VIVRDERADDVDAIAAVVRDAFLAEFGSDVEVGLVASMRERGELVIALVAEDEDEDGVGLVGFIAFSEVTVDGEQRRVLGLGPVAASPSRQRQGIGSALIEAGLARARADGWEAVVLLGHEAYYPRFGFVPAAPQGLVGDYGDHAGWMALSLVDGEPVPRGHAVYCSAFLDL